MLTFFGIKNFSKEINTNNNDENYVIIKKIKNIEIREYKSLVYASYTPNNSERNNNAVKVGYVVPNSPAEKSGIMINDIIIKVGNRDIETASDVIRQISKNGINKKINILLKRRNKFISLKVIPTDITNLQNK